MPKRKKASKKKSKRSKYCCKRVTKSDEDGGEGGALVISQNCFLDYMAGTLSFRAHFIKGYFSKEEMMKLREKLLACPESYWETRSDGRGERRQMYTGRWVERCKDKIHPAGLAGKLEAKAQFPILRDLLQQLGEKATLLLKLKRPDIYFVLQEAGIQILDFGSFHLFMCPAGRSLSHLDSQDFISFIFLIYVKPDCGGKGLELTQANVSFPMEIGDVCLLDSDSLSHGSANFDGAENANALHEEDRLVGLFIIHRRLIHLLGVNPEDTKRENYSTRTVPIKQ
jgi:hypothetical protein